MNLKRIFRRILLFPLSLILGAFTGTVTEGHKFNKKYYQAQFLEGKENFVVFDQFAAREKKAEIPKNAGDNVEFTRVAPFPMKRSPLDEGDAGSSTKIYGNTVQATVAEYGDHVKPSKKFWITSMDKDMAETAVEQGKSAASTIDSLIWEVVANGGIGLLADADATKSGEVTCAAACSEILVNYGQVRKFTVGATVTDLTVADLDHIPAVGDLARVVCTKSLVAGDKVSVDVIRKALALLESNGSAVFDDGYYHGVYTPLQKYDFQRDDEWTNMKHFAAPKDLYRNLEGEIFGIKFHKDNVPYRHAVGAIDTYVAAGAVYVISIFGKNAFGNVRVSGIDRKFYIFPPVGDPDNPLAMYGSMGWYELCCPVVLNGCNIVNIFNVPTSV
ncbi:hypothetical protein ES705_38235 [subsurface metagenome]